MPEIAEAKHAYHRLCSIQNANLGPIWQFPSETIDEARGLHPIIDRCLRAARVEEGGRILHVPSPWHAFFVAVRLQYEAQRVNAHLLFRGQHSSDYALVSSLDRLIANRRECHERAVHILKEFLCKGLAGVWEDMNFSFSSEMTLALAQHYGIKTRLLDFTADPAIAVLFAAERPRNIGCPTASVYIAPLPWAHGQGALVILPPPFVHRLYLQRGVFLETESPERLLNKSEFPEIRFPIEYAHGPF